MVIEYLNYHDEISPGPISFPFGCTVLTMCAVGEWDSEFVNVHHETLFKLVNAADYLDISFLLDLTCAKVSSLILAHAFHDTEPEVLAVATGKCGQNRTTVNVTEPEVLAGDIITTEDVPGGHAVFP